MMRYKAVTAARSYLLPMSALLLAAMTLGGCVAYNRYPTYGYTAYPSSYYGGYPSSYAYSYNYPATSTYYAPGYAPVYTPNYNGAYDTYRNSGGGEN
jgi:hypothetical protein